jgi:hypothetical protein
MKVRSFTLKESVMLSQNVLELQASPGGPALPGVWKLPPGRAISLLPRSAGVLAIEQGRVWATFDGPHAGHANESGDHFLQAGQQICLRDGQRLVVEAWSEARATPVYFEWTPLATADTVCASRWHVAVVQPLHDCGRALLMAGNALGRLLMGLAGYGDYLAAGRGRVMPELEANRP